MIWLISLLCLEVAARIALEVREARAMHVRGGVFAVLRVIPLVNDIVPLPESRAKISQTHFIESHEEGHKYHRHAILRNLLKVIFWMLAVGFLMYLLVREALPFWQCILWLHLVAIPCRMFFHLYCWNQEYEADYYALKALGRQKAKGAMSTLLANEIPRTKLFAVIYREHPTAVERRRHLFEKR